MDLRPEHNILSLCAGVGGLELGILLALDYLGEAGRGVCYVERESAAAASLVASMEAGWFHPAPVWSDMLTFDGKPWRGLIHILASGDPCQENSVAGKQLGAAGARFLASEVCRIAAECRADIIFRENVVGNIDGQLAAIVPALEALGYRVAAGIFSSAETGNTMRRERLFIMAEREGCERGVGTRSERKCLSHAGGSSLGLALADGGIASTERQQRGGKQRLLAQGDGDDRTSGMDGTERPQRGADGASRRDHWQDGDAQWQEGATGFGTSGRALAVSPDLASASGPRSQGGELVKPFGQVKRLNAPRSTAEFRGALPPAVIPGPGDSRWRALLDRFPEYQPALSQEEAESHLRRGIDALAHRTERLRATGNGVDSVVAAYAFLSLRARLASRRTSPTHHVLIGTAA